jgi:hypothetical protein
MDSIKNKEKDYFSSGLLKISKGGRFSTINAI